MTNKIADKSAFLKPAKLKTTEFTCPGIGLVRMRELSGSAYSNQFQDWLRPKGKVNAKRELVMWTKLVTLCVVDADDNPILSEDDIPAIESQPRSVLTMLQRQALELHGLAEEETESDPLEQSEG